MQVINFIPHPISTTNGERESMNVSISSIENKPHTYLKRTLINKKYLNYVYRTVGCHQSLKTLSCLMSK